MGVVTEIGRLACCSWAPSGSHVAAGTYAGAVDTAFEASSTLELLHLDIANARVIPSTPVRVPEKFASISWGVTSRAHPAGLIAGGLSDGTVRVWDAAGLLRPATDAAARDPNRALLLPANAPAKHKGPVNDVNFNYFVPTLLATGGADGQLLVWDLSNPASPTINPPGAMDTSASKDELIAVAWNPKVQHILGTGSSSGVVSVWDVKNRKQVINMRNPRGRLRASSIVWHPHTPTQVLVACDEDDGTGAQLWDLRNATAPLLSLSHHAPRGVMSATWCPQDAGLVLTTSRDGRSALVSPVTGELVAELPKSMSWNFDVQWSPRSAGMYLTSAFDGRVSFNSILTANAAPSVSPDTANLLEESFGLDRGEVHSGMAIQSPRTLVAERESVTMTVAPKWLQRPCSVSFGFGGRVVKVSSKEKSSVGIAPSVESNVSLGTSLAEVDSVLAGASPDDPSSLAAFCSKSAADAPNAGEKTAWDVLALQFQSDSRRKMLRYLGFQPAPAVAGDMSDQVFGMEHSPVLASPVRPVAPEKVEKAADDIDALLDGSGSMAGMNGAANGIDSLSLDGPAPWDAQEGESLLDSTTTAGVGAVPGKEPQSAPSPDNDGAVAKRDFSNLSPADVDALVKTAVIGGDFELAVDACLFAKRNADALVIAYAGGPSLWHRAHGEYLASVTNIGGSSAVMGAVAGSKNKLDEFMRAAADAGKDSWKEALAIILTYVPGEEFGEACSALGQRVLEKNNLPAALTCFTCACNTHMVTSLWLRGRPASGNMAAAISSRADRTVALVAKIRMVSAASALSKGEGNIGDIRAWDDLGGSVLFEYGAMLAAQGDVAAAVKYLNPLDPALVGVRGQVEDYQAQANESLAIQELEAGSSGTAAEYGGPNFTEQNDNPYNPSTYGYGADQGISQPVQQSHLVQPPPPMMPSQPAVQPSVEPPPTQGQWNGGYSAPPPMPVSPSPMGAVPSVPMPPAPPRPNVFGNGGMSPAGQPGGGSYSKTFYPNQALSPTAMSPAPVQDSPAQSGYSVMTPNAPPAPVMPAIPTTPAPPPPPMADGSGIAAYGSPAMSAPPAQHNGHASAPAAGMLSAPAYPAVPVAPAVPQMPGVPVVPPADPSGAMMSYNSQSVAAPPPPPPPSVGDAPPPMSYHAKAKVGAGASLPASSEVAVARQRQKPLSSSGVPGGAPRRSPSTSSSLASMGREASIPLDKVDVRNVPADQQVIVKSLRGSFQYAMGRNSTPIFKKKMDDVSKKLGRLLTQLNAKEVDPAIVTKLVYLAQGIGKGDYVRARQVTNDFQKQVDWESNRHWIQALSRLIEAVVTGR